MIALDFNAAFAARALKGKDTAPFDPSYVAPGERPWHTLAKEQVRYFATRAPARLLSKALRQAAARDPGLHWDEASRSYRLGRAATSAPPPANGAGAEGEGVSESLALRVAKTGGCGPRDCKPQITTRNGGPDAQ